MPTNESIIPGFDDSSDKTLRITLDTEETVPRCIDVYLRGSIDNYNSAFFQERLDRIIEAGFNKIIFFCSALEYVSSTGIGVFANYFSKFRDLGGNMVFVELQQKVLEVFQILGFSHIFHIVSNGEDALQVFTDQDKIIPSVFPKTFSCPICNVHLKTTHAGKFRCAKCKGIIAVDESGHVTL